MLQPNSRTLVSISFHNASSFGSISKASCEPQAGTARALLARSLIGTYLRTLHTEVEMGMGIGRIGVATQCRTGHVTMEASRSTPHDATQCHFYVTLKITKFTAGVL